MTSRGQTRRLSGCKVNTFYLKSDIREREFCAEDDFLVDIHAVFRGIAEEDELDVGAHVHPGLGGYGGLWNRDKPVWLDSTFAGALDLWHGDWFLPVYQ